MNLNLQESPLRALSIDVGERGKRSVREQKRADFHTGFVQEIAEYIIANQGPDSEGSAHPTIKIIQVNVREEALQIGGENPTQTVRKGLELIATRNAYAGIRKMHGKVKFSISLVEMRYE